MVKFYFCVLVVACFTSSCSGPKNISYFNNIQAGTITTPDNLELPIQKNDVLSIYISSLDPEATALFNAQNESRIVSTNPSGSTGQSAGYLVIADGTIQLPMLGNIKAAGLTKRQLRDHIAGLLNEKKLLIDPIVTIRHLNFKVTVLGEVKSPTVIPVPNEKITLLEALGLAGDLTIFGKRENVLLIREKQTGEKQISRINLNSDQLFTSEFYYLQPNDIIYVEPGEARVASLNQTRVWLPVVISSLSLIANFIRITR